MIILTSCNHLLFVRLNHITYIGDACVTFDIFLPSHVDIDIKTVKATLALHAAFLNSTRTNIYFSRSTPQCDGKKLTAQRDTLSTFCVHMKFLSIT